MNHVFARMTPRFLKEIDQDWMVNRPQLWASRVHYVLFFGAIAWGLVLLHAWLRPMSLSEVPNPDLSSTLLLIPATLGLIFWAWRVSRFQVQKQYGQYRAGMMFRDHVVYAGVILFLGLAPFAHHMITTERIAALIPASGLAEDRAALSIFKDDLYGFDRDLTLFLYPKYESLSKEAASAFAYTFHRYSGESFPYTVGELLTTFYKAEGIYLDADHAPLWHRMELNLNRMEFAQSDEAHYLFEQPLFLRSLPFFLMGIWLFLMVFFKTGWQTVAGVVVLGTGIFFLILAVPFHNFAPYMMLFLFIWIFLMVKGAKSRQTPWAVFWRRITLGLAAVTTILLPLVLATLYSNPGQWQEETLIFYLIAGACLGYAAWNFYFRPRFEALSANPWES